MTALLEITATWTCLSLVTAAAGAVFGSGAKRLAAERRSAAER